MRRTSREAITRRGDDGEMTGFFDGRGGAGLALARRPVGKGGGEGGRAGVSELLLLLCGCGRGKEERHKKTLEKKKLAKSTRGFVSDFEASQHHL